MDLPYHDAEHMTCRSANGLLYHSLLRSDYCISSGGYHTRWDGHGSPLTMMRRIAMVIHTGIRGIYHGQRLERRRLWK